MRERSTSGSARGRERRHRSRVLAAIVCVLGTLLAACPSAQVGEKPLAPELTMTPAGPKRLRFTWSGGAGATSYELFRERGGERVSVSGPLPVGVLEFLYEMSLPEVAGSWFVLDACNPAGCTPSGPVLLSGLVLESLVGYVKASSPAASDAFGHSVALTYEGATLVVGAPGEDGVGSGVDPVDTDGPTGANSGAAYVYGRDTTTGAWTDPVYLKASNPDPDDGFGYSVATSYSGSHVAVGAPYEDGAGSGLNPGDSDILTNAGAAYLFLNSQVTGVTEFIYLKSSSPVQNGLFGISVAVAGDEEVVAVGAEEGDGTGAVYVFATAPTAEWVGPLRVTPDDLQSGDYFGHDVALSGDGTLLAVGALFERSSGGGVNPIDDDIGPTSGAVYLFELDGANSATQVAYIKSPDPEAGEWFGASVALSADGDVLVVGAPYEDGTGTGVNPPNDDGNTDSGAAYVYTREPGGGWELAAYLKAGQIDAFDMFGHSVTVSPDGGTIAVGAPGEDGSGSGVGPEVDEASAGSGAVYLFYREEDGSWRAGPYVKSLDADVDDGFGYDVALSEGGQTLAATAWREDGSGSVPTDDSMLDAGAAFMY